MGQAKQRGTFKQRLMMAVKRNKELQAAIVNDKRLPMNAKIRMTENIQHTATRMTAQELLAKPRYEN